MNLQSALEPYSVLLSNVRAVVNRDLPIYLVGGALRDAILGKSIHDLDLIVPNSAISIARRFANRIGAAFYPLDQDRETGRVIIKTDGYDFFIDFASFRGSDLESDLRARDLTINAIAIDLRNLKSIIDPLGGVEDINNHVLRACSFDSYIKDPLRIIRTVRFAVDLNFQIQPNTLKKIRANIQRLHLISQERLRDELFRIFEGLKPDSAIRILEQIGVLDIILPETIALKGVSQSSPHHFDVWEHSLLTMTSLNLILRNIITSSDENSSENFYLRLLSLRLRRFRKQISEHLNIRLNPLRSRIGLLCFVALYHDIAKPETLQFDEEERTRFFGHSKLGAEIAARRADQLRLSQNEIQFIYKIVNNHMRPFLLSQSNGLPSRRAIYRFFRDSQEAGVDICFLSLADLMATYGSSLTEDIWDRQLDICRILFEAWWDRSRETVYPQPFLNGNDLIREFTLSPGIIIGQLLEHLREAQAAGEIFSRDEALEYAKQWLIEQKVIVS
jgi:poly(A) polymerase